MRSESEKENNIFIIFAQNLCNLAKHYNNNTYFFWSNYFSISGFEKCVNRSRVEIRHCENMIVATMYAYRKRASKKERKKMRRRKWARYMWWQHRTIIDHLPSLSSCHRYIEWTASIAMANRVETGERGILYWEAYACLCCRHPHWWSRSPSAKLAVTYEPLEFATLDAQFVIWPSLHRIHTCFWYANQNSAHHNDFNSIATYIERHRVKWNKHTINISTCLWFFSANY